MAGGSGRGDGGERIGDHRLRIGGEEEGDERK